MTLLLVDGTNIVMRCAFGDEIPPEQAVPNAMRMIARAAQTFNASSLVVAFDFPGVPTWRHELAPTYKATRTVSTEPYIVAAVEAMSVKAGWYCTAAPGFEADDVIATVAKRVDGRQGVYILSSDGDLMQLVCDWVRVARPMPGGDTFEWFNPAAVKTKYGVAPSQIPDYKALMGDRGDNVHGVPGIGEKRAAALLQKFPTVAAIVDAGRGGYSKDCEKVAAHAETLMLALKLVTLEHNAPVSPIPREKAAITATTFPQ